MKKLLLTILILSSSLCFSQNWAPFKAADTVKNFYSNTTLQLIRNIKPIQTVLADTSYLDSNLNTIKVFRKGFSSIQLFKTNPGTSILSKKIVKGRILGDTVIIGADSSFFMTRDHRGFSLVFPHHYHLNASWTFGISKNYKLVATCDSLYQDSIFNNLDSIAQVTIQVYDSSNAIDSTHHFNTDYIVTKQNGIFETIDFTGLDTAYRHKAFEWSPQTTVDENRALTVGEEYQFYQSLYGMYDPYYGTHTYNVIVIADSTANNNMRYVSYLRLEQDRPPIPGNYTTPIIRDTVNVQFNINTIYCDNRSSIVEMNNNRFSYPIFGLTGSSDARRIYYRYQTGNWIRHDSTSNLAPANLNTIDSILLMNYFVDDRLQLIGISNEYRKGNSGFPPQPSNSKNIFYFKKGSQTWGTPSNLSVGLEDNGANKKKVAIYPNPTKGHLNINSTLGVEVIQCYSVQGKIVQEVIPNKQENIEVGLQGPPGVYFMRVQLIDGTVRNFKLIKQ